MQTPEKNVKFSKRPFLLFVGARAGYKNFERFIRAFALSKILRDEFDVICFGGGELELQECNLIAEVGLNSDQVLHKNGWR